MVPKIALAKIATEDIYIYIGICQSPSRFLFFAFIGFSGFLIFRVYWFSVFLGLSRLFVFVFLGFSCFLVFRVSWFSCFLFFRVSFVFVSLGFSVSWFSRFLFFAFVGVRVYWLSRFFFVILAFRVSEHPVLLPPLFDPSQFSPVLLQSISIVSMLCCCSP